jgi:outer membrane protein assembly factor BamA
MSALATLSAAAVLLLPVQTAGTTEVVVEIRVHGNQLTPDEEVIRLSGLVVGAPFETGTIEAVRARLRSARRFEDVDVLKRYASIADQSRILVVIVVNEGPVRIQVPDAPDLPIRVVRRRGATNLMLMPVLDAEDGYGLTYGVRLAYVGVAGRRGRLSFPLTWGGFKRAGAEFDRPFESGPLTRIQVGTGVDQSRNPAFDEQDTRRRVWARAERTFGPVRAAGLAGWQRVSFADADDRIRSAGVEVTFDTRSDAILPRNAVYATASWSRLHLRSAEPIDRTRLEARGYLGLVGQTVLVVRAHREGADRTMPPFLQSLLGGWSSLRGFKAGAFAGDQLVAGSLELRVPLSSPLQLGKFGASVFVDAGAAYRHDQRLADQPVRAGVGGAVWFTATAFRMGVSVARGRGATTRVNFGAGLAY